MGKSKSGKSASKGGSGSANAKSQPKCTCDHPYQCNCGNRPERPSKGHKWYPDDQIWAGKGHKQKGGSGQTSSVAKEAVTTSVGKTKVDQWQRLPSQLLAEVCKKERRPPPKFKALENVKGGTKYRCIVQDAKVNRRGGEHDLIMIPAQAVQNAEQAKEEAALLALLHLTPSLPHERKLPEPYKTTWVNAVEGRKEERRAAARNKGTAAAATNKEAAAAAKFTTTRSGAASGAPSSSSSKAAASSSNLSMSHSFATQAERKKQRSEKQKLRNAKIAKHEARRQANRDHQVFMSAQVRKRIETLLRGDYKDVLASLNSEEGRDDDGDDKEVHKLEDEEDENEVRAYVCQRLVHEGFSVRQAKAAFGQLPPDAAVAAAGGDNVDDQMDGAYEECLQWLCIHLDEEQLPMGFDPRGRTLDVVVNAKAAPAAKSGDDSSNGGSALSAGTANNNKGKRQKVDPKAAKFVSVYGVTAEEATLILRSSAASKSDNESDERSILWKALCAAAQVDLAATSDGAGGEEEDADGNREIAAEELEALEAIFPPEECSVTRKGGETIIHISIPSDDGDTTASDGTKLEIRTVDGCYPNLPPRLFVCGGWTGKPSGYGTAAHVDAVKFLSDLSRGDPMVYELYGFVQALLQSGPDGLATPIASGGSSLLLPHLDGGVELIQDMNMQSGGSSSNAKAPQNGNKNTAATNTKRDKPARQRSNVGAAARALRRPRTKSFFWSKRPRDTPPATAFPKLGATIERARKGLPAAKAREEFLSVMRKADAAGRVLLVTGETGCGKTTQIPQFILEEAPRDAKIVVAQPRRLAATGVAARVADERGESSPGKGSVGYVVRGDVAMANSTRLMFCTTGVLLRQLQSDGALDCVSHIVVDEVHERHLDTDVLLGVLKTCLATTPHLRVVLMSATMDADRFAAYWGSNTPRMHIPGFTYPVEDYTLEDVLSITGYIPPKKGKKKKYFNNSGGYKGRKQSPWADSEKSDNEDEEGDMEEEASVAESEATSTSGKTNPQAPSIPLDDLVKRVNENDIDYDMLASLIGRLLRTKTANDDGSMLVFLPGAPEIAKAETAIRQIVRGASTLLLPLHGGLQPKDQQRVFLKSDRGTTKIILSTNVAETSITIPDCTIVIDTCREKQSSYDPSNRMPLLIERFASRDSLKQRRGRAGRVRAGTCYKLISRATHEKLSEHGEPEIRRCALDQTLLSLLFLGVERGSGNFLGKLLDPPSQQSIDAAIYSLEKLGAVIVANDGDRRLTLTPLGMHLAGIPAPPCVGKILVMGSLLGCRGAALAMAAGMSGGRSPFLRVDVFNNNRRRRNDDEDKEESMEEMKQKKVLANRADLFKSVGNSDLAMLAAAYLQWDGTSGGGGERKRFCESLGLSFNGMRDMKQLVRQLDSALISAGYYSSREAEMNANSWRVIRSCIVSALAPSQIVRVERPSAKYAETKEGAIEKDGVARELKFFIRGDESSTTAASSAPLGNNINSNTSSAGQTSFSLNRRYHGIAEERVFMHPSSANFSVGSYSCPWLVYHELVRTSKSFLRDATESSSYALLLFGGKLDVKASDEQIIVDDYVHLSANARIGALIGGLRRKVDELLSNKVKDPSLDIAGSVEMRIIVSLLKSDGLGQ